MNPRMARRLRRAAPLCLTAFACVGTLGTAYLASRAGAKSALEIQAEEEKLGRKLEGKERFKLVGKNYIPTLLCAGATIGANIGSFKMSKEANALLLSSYMALKKSYDAYQDKFIEEYGPDTYAEFTEALSDNGWADLESLPEDGERVLFCDAFSGVMFNAPWSKVLKAELQLNKIFTEYGCAELMSWYGYLDLPKERIDRNEFKSLAWIEEPDFKWINFQHFPTTTDDGLQCTIIEFEIDPTPQLY